MSKLSRLLIALTLATLLAAPAVHADEEPAPRILPQLKRSRPDMDNIRRDTYNPSSPYYYPRLMQEFERNDTLMKIDKFRHLYYGYLFQEDYTPYRSGRHPVDYSMPARPSRQQCDSIIAAADRALADEPFDLTQMMMKINALRIKGQTNKADILQYKFNYLLMAIVSSGTGEDEEHAWVVIDPQHEYVLLNMLDYIVDDHIFYDPHFEYITVTDPAGNPLGGYYFNIKNMLDEYYRKHPDETE